MNSEEQTVIAVSGTACVTYLWTEGTVRRYLSSDLQDYKALANTLIAYSQSLREAFRRQKWIYLMRTDYLKSFFETGVLSIYHDAFVKERISEEDRKSAARDMVKLIEKGELDIVLAEPHRFPLTEMWDGFFLREEIRLFNYNSQKCTTITLTEPSFNGAVFDYYEDLVNSEYVIKGKAAADMIREWVNEYLN